MAIDLSLELGLMSQAEPDAARAAQRIAISLRTNADMWKQLSRNTDKLPIILIRERRMIHCMPSDSAAFLRRLKAERRD